MIDPEDYEVFVRCAMGLNRHAEERPRFTPGATQSSTIGGDRPGDDFNRRANWSDALPEGWDPVRQVGDVICWRRPGKSGYVWSATTGFCKSELRGELLHVFTSSAPPFEMGGTYSKFEAYTLVHHRGDFSAAAQALAEKGYGTVTARLIMPRLAPAAPPEPAPVPGVLEKRDPFGGPPIPASLLRKADRSTAWLWHGYLARGGITMLSALWKAGKTTLLAHLLKSLEAEGSFCGLGVSASRVLYVTEEHEHLWADRRDRVGLKDHVEFLVRPFSMKPRMEEWVAFLVYLQGVCRERAYDLVVFDTISNLWPVKDENDAAKVQEALMPLHHVAENAAFALVHHLRKGDGKEATASRGSGALPAFVDIIVELRRYEASNRQDCRRVLSSYGRFTETPDELVVELTKEGYVAHGDRATLSWREIKDTLASIMPVAPPGLTYDQLMDAWPNPERPRRQKVLDALREGAEEGLWVYSGAGMKGDPYLYYRPRS